MKLAFTVQPSIPVQIKTPPALTAQPAVPVQPVQVSADPENRIERGSDGGVYVPEMRADLVAYYILAKA